MRKVLVRVCLCTIFTLLVCSLTQVAEAIPTFARKYRTSCTTCHIGFNKLNPFGEAYRLNGFQVPGGDEAYVKEESVSMGAPAWKRVWPNAVWPGEIPLGVPISMMIHQRAKWNESAGSQGVPKVNFDFPNEWELFIGGNLGEMISFLGEFVLYEDGSVAGTERLFLQFSDLLAGGPYDILPKDALNLKIGYFHVAADPFRKPTRRTLTKYLPSDYTAGSAAFKLRNLQSGFEANGIVGRRLFYAAGLVNGNSSLGGDDNSKKDPYFRLAYKFGGLGFDGSGEELGAELKQTNNWVDNSVTVGAFGYSGKELVSSATNEFYRAGVDCRLQWQDLDLFGALLYGKDDDPSATGASVDTRAWFTQAEYVFYPWLIGALRYENLNYDDATNDIRKWVPSLSIYARANVRLILEGEVYPDGDDGSNNVLADLAISF